MFRHHQRSHCRDQSLHPIIISSMLDPLPWDITPHYLRSWLQRPVTELITNLLRFFLGQVFQIIRPGSVCLNIKLSEAFIRSERVFEVRQRPRMDPYFVEILALTCLHFLFMPLNPLSFLSTIELLVQISIVVMAA